MSGASRRIEVAPPPERRIGRVPDEWTVWAFSDPHGVASGLEPALVSAGLVDEGLRWTAPPGTALVGCGDYLDRGRRSRRVIELLRRLEAEAEAAGGALVLARGNHEHLLLQLAAGETRDVATWFVFGGIATLASFGVSEPDLADVRASILALDDVSPGVLAWLAGLAHAVRWRDVLFVHGGLPAEGSLADLGVRTDDHLYVRAPFFTTPWSSGAFAGFEADGVRRVVFGHTPRANGAEVVHGGRSINLDTNAPGNPGMGPDALRLVTLLELRGDVAFADARRIEIDTAGAPDASDAVPPSRLGSRPRPTRRPAAHPSIVAHAALEEPMSPLHHTKMDPRKPHAFVAHSDPGLGAMASGGGGPQRPIGPVAVTSAYIRESDACAIEGCGRPRTDDIHATAGD